MLRKEREKFRKRLVQLIIKNEEEEVSDPNKFPNADEKELLRYYYYIHHGINTVLIAPIQRNWVDNVIMLIPDKLQHQTESLNQLISQMQVYPGLITGRGKTQGALARRGLERMRYNLITIVFVITIVLVLITNRKLQYFFGV